MIRLICPPFFPVPMYGKFRHFVSKPYTNPRPARVWGDGLKVADVVHLKSSPLFISERCKMSLNRMILGIVLIPLVLAPLASAQVQNPAQVQVQRGGDNPIYKITINVVER